jgi:alkylated DNA repair dioxygenase AlkB
MNNFEQLLLEFAPTNAALAGRDWLGLQIDHRQFLDAQQEEWLCPSPDLRGRILAIASFAEEPKGTAQQPSGLITVSLGFQPRLLPKLTVPFRLAGVWREGRIDSLPPDVEFVFWPGALPLFAVTRIIVPSAEERARLLGLVRQVSNVSVPDVAIDVDQLRVHKCRGTDVPNIGARGIGFTEEYGLVRGATTMAVWAVPRVDPWFEILVASLSADRSRVKSVAEALAASWYAEAPWLLRSFESPCETFDCRLWRAALRVLREGHHEGGLDATAAVQRVHNYAAGPSRPTDAAAENWCKQTLSVLRGKEDFRLDDWKQCPVGKALQVLLLRTQPEHFAKWLQDLPGIPPAIWFSAATLCGYLHGYRRLATTFRGSAVQRRTLAIHALNVTSDSPEPMAWPFPDTAQLTWRRDEHEFVLMCGDFEFARKGAHPRTLWYIADLNDAVEGSAAEELARRFRWNCFTRRLKVSNTSIPITSGPNSEVSIKAGAVVVQGSVEFDLPETACITESLDRAAFRKCLAVEGAPNILPPPTKGRARDLEQAPGQPIHDNPQYHAHRVIHGLLWVENYLTPFEEAELVAQIDAAEWREDLKRCVQHYGWRYDYKARQINTEMRLGPLPPWAAHLAERLAREKLLPHVPDQVIVNEYIGKQGISKHVDCKPCFEDGIATISLLESWEMVFSRGRDKKREGVLLPRRSVTILIGEARYQWMHEIPRRATEPGGFDRKRRISITFRKVVLNTAPNRSPRKRRGALESNDEPDSKGKVEQ